MQIAPMIKERYFTPQALQQKALELHHQVTAQTRDRHLPYRPVQSGLLVLDMQEYFLDPTSHAYIPSSEAILAGIVQLIEEYATHGRPIIFTQHVNTDHNAGNMSNWWKDLLTVENPLHRLNANIDITKGTLIQKCQYDAFFQTNLDDILQNEGVNQVVICGVMTHLCCETTARSAFMRGYQVFFLVDGTATYNLELHRASLLNLAHGFASLVLMKDILQAMRGEHGS